MKFFWVKGDYRKTIGAYSMGVRHSNYCGPSRLIACHVIGFVRDVYYDGTCYELHMWKFVAYFDIKHMPDGKDLTAHLAKEKS